MNILITGGNGTIDSFLRPFQKIERKISNLSNSLREQARKESGLEF